MLRAVLLFLTFSAVIPQTAAAAPAQAALAPDAPAPGWAVKIEQVGRVTTPPAGLEFAADRAVDPAVVRAVPMGSAAAAGETSLILQSGDAEAAMIASLGRDDSARIEQSGFGNNALITQSGQFARGSIQQAGIGNLATIRQ